MKLSVIVPAYNESPYIQEVLSRVSAIEIPKEIIVIDDGSTDGTTRIVKDYQQEDQSVLVHTSLLNLGKATAIRMGLKYATGDIILIQDADLEYDPQDYPALLKPFLNGEADVVYGSRFRGKGLFYKPVGMRWHDWVVNKLLTLMANLLYGAGITDEATAYKAFRREVIESIPLRSTRFEFFPQVTAKLRRRGYQIHEVPISYQARTTNEGKKIRWYDAFHAVYTLIRYVFWQ